MQISGIIYALFNKKAIFVKQKNNEMNRPIKIYSIINLIIILSSVVVIPLTAQDYNATPKISNYQNFNTIASSQNWSVTQDENGLLYFANSHGLLEFDGKRWQLHPLPGKYGLRTVAYHKDSRRLYSGSFEEFGYWERDAWGRMHYHSLKTLVEDPSQLHNDEIWSIVFRDNQVFFRTFVNYLAYDGKGIQLHKLPTACLVLSNIRNMLYAGSTTGLYSLHNGTARLMPKGEHFTNEYQLSGILPFTENRLLLATQSKGIFIHDGKNFTPWHTEADALLKHAQINRVLTVRDSLYLFGTLLDGIVAINRHGQLLWHLNKTNGLQNNTVLGMYADRENNVWLALDNGIDQVEINPALRFYRGNYDNVEAVYAIREHNNRLYLGTNKGLFQCPRNGRHFEMIPNTQGQVWNLSEWGGELLCGHNNGTFRIDGDRAVAISGITGGYCLLDLPGRKNETLLQSTYTSLVVFLKDRLGHWQQSHVVDGFMEPVRYIEADHNQIIWAGHIEKGLFRIRLDEELKRAESVIRYDSIDGVATERIGVFKINNRIVFTTGKELYTYDEIHNRIISYNQLNEVIGQFRDAHKIIADRDGRYWFFRNDEIALIEIDHENKVKLIKKLTAGIFDNQLLLQHESVFSNKNGQSYIGLRNGFVLLQPSGFNTTPPTAVLLRQIAAFNKDKETDTLKTMPETTPVLPANYNSIRFSFAYPVYGLHEQTVWYKLEGLEKDWSRAEANYEAAYSRLPSGEYKFIIRVTDIQNNTVAQQEFGFTIRPAWYSTSWANLSLVLLIILITLGINWLWRRRDSIQQLKEQELKDLRHKEEQKEKEQEITRLTNERLNSELIFKSRELTNSTMSIIQKDNVLLELKKELQKDNSAKNISGIIKFINKNLSTEANWKRFQDNFDAIHDHFFHHLKQRFPSLTPHDLQLCAYLRLNLSTKEIAQLTGNSVRGVEVARYRLRKKLGLSQETNLNAFMIEFKY